MLAEEPKTITNDDTKSEIQRRLEKVERELHRRKEESEVNVSEHQVSKHEKSRTVEKGRFVSVLYCYSYTVS